METDRRRMVGIVVVTWALPAKGDEGRTEMRGRALIEQPASWRLNCREATLGVDVNAIVLTWDRGGPQVARQLTEGYGYL